jgi:predicted nucleic acid-binding protein
MILVDTCVLIDFNRSKGRDPKLRRLFASLPLEVAGVVRAEMLAGAKNTADRARLQLFLDTFRQFPTREAIWDMIGDNQLTLRRNGINVPFQDVIIATLAIDAGLELWTRDSHFARMQAVLPALRLFPEPP